MQVLNLQHLLDQCPGRNRGIHQPCLENVAIGVLDEAAVYYRLL